ncbi:hypothetical protein Btru_036024 [Bulinus truncatus]|nr:hypothetical protein Btru_036024 [Bulinus truncatus]
MEIDQQKNSPPLVSLNELHYTVCQSQNDRRTTPVTVFHKQDDTCDSLDKQDDTCDSLDKQDDTCDSLDKQDDTCDSLDKQDDTCDSLDKQ